MASSKTNTKNSEAKARKKGTIAERVTPSTRPSLSSQGAGASVTNRFGETSYYKSSKDVPGYADTKNGKNVSTSKGNTPISAFDAAGKVINSSTLKPTGTVKYPEYKDTPVSDFAQNNSGLTGGESNITTDGTNLNVEQPKNEFSALEKIYQDYSTSMTDAQDNMTSAADIQKKLEKETKIKQLRQEEADYASQINTITANRDAAVLSLEGQGRGQTEGFVGGEQARINREAAIKALPVQAQLAAAQNKVQLAQDHINTWGSILMQDATNKYNFKKEQFGALKDYLTDVEKLRLNKLEKENDRKYAEKQSNIQQLTAIMSDAAANGQAGLISQIKTLNPETLTSQQLLNLAGQLRKPVVGTKTSYELKNIGTTDNPQWVNYDSSTGATTPVAGTQTPTNPQATGQTQNQLDFMLKTAKNVEGLASASGDTGILGKAGRFLFGQDEYTNLIAETNTLRTNMLTLATDPTIKKFFGPQMSNADVQLMTSAGTTLNPELQSPAKLKEENMRITDFIERAKLSTQGVTEFGKTDDGVRVGVTPQGKLVDAYGNEYTSDGRPVNEPEKESRGFFGDFLSTFGL